MARMWLQATITLDDLVHYLRELLPLRIQLDEGGQGSSSTDEGRVLDLAAPRHVTMVPGVGVEIETSAHIVWPVLGIHVPATVKSVRALFKPSIVDLGAGESAIGFALEVDHLDLSLVPGIVESAIKDVLNAELARPGKLPAWNFSRTMNFRFDVPRKLGFKGSFTLAASWADLKVTDEGLTLAMSFVAGVEREQRSLVEPATGAPRSAPAEGHDAPSEAL